MFCTKCKKDTITINVTTKNKKGVVTTEKVCFACGNSIKIPK
jgi:hypothetical protein